MNHSSLVAFLDGRLLPEQFGAEIEEEVAACVEGCKKRGVGHIVVTDGPNTLITREHAAVLLGTLADGRMPFYASQYIADGVIMSDDFDFADETVAEAFHFVADDSVVPTAAQVNEVLAAVS